MNQSKNESYKRNIPLKGSKYDGYDKKKLNLKLNASIYITHLLSGIYLH